MGILLAHISPSLEGLRLVFLMQQGMSLAEAQAWMAQQLGDTQYDSCVKDYARCSFIVPRDYVLWLDEEGLFSAHIVIQSEAKNLGNTAQPLQGGCTQILRVAQDDTTEMGDANADAPEILRRNAPLDDKKE